MSTLKANKYQHVDRTSPSIEINADGSVSIASTVTYEDVTSVDSVGMVTARSGLRATAGGLVVTAGISTFGGDVSIADKIVHTGDTNTSIRFPVNDNITFETIGVEAVRIDAAQRLIHGATASNNVGGFGGAAIQIEGLTAGTSALSLIRHDNNAVGSTILMGKSRGTSDAAVTIVQDDDNVARIIAYGADGTDTESSLGAIQFDVDGTPGSNDMPGRIVLSTTADGASTYTERLRITSAGNVGINDNSPTDLLTISHAANDSGGISIKNTNNSQNSAIAQIELSGGDNAHARVQFECNGKYSTIRSDGNGHLTFFTNGSNERLRIDASGNFWLNSSGSYNTDRQVFNADGTSGLVEATNELNIFQNKSSSGGLYIGYKDIANGGTITDYHFYDGTGSDTKANISCANLAVAAGGGIDFSAQTASSTATTAAELLDHYEYGTWTPTIEGQSSAGTATYPQRRGDYTKIGNRVFANCYISYNSGNGSGNLMIAGLPFNVKNVSACDHSGGTMMSNITVSNADDVCSICSYTGNNLTKVFFYTTRSAATYTPIPYDSSGEIIMSISYNTK